MRRGMLVGVLTLIAGFGPGTVWAEEEAAATAEEAPVDPTRGKWDSFLDPLRDAEDQVTGAQKSVEDKSKVHIGGGILKSVEQNFNEPASSINSLRSLDPDASSWEFDFAQVSATRPSEGWFVPGFGVKLDAGRVAKRIKADWNGNGAVAVGDVFEKNSFEVQESYLTWTVPDDADFAKGLTFKGGKFVTLLGAEVIEPWANPNFSRSFLFGFAIPFTHTGGLMTYPVSDKLSVTGGVIVGWDNVGDNNDSPSFIGNATYAAHDRVTLSANGIYGPEQTNKIGPKRGITDLVATIKATDQLTFLLNYDWGHEEDALPPSKESALWQGFAAIATYAFTDRTSASVRGEWFEDHNGARTGLRQTLWEATVTGKYLITQHLVGTLEYRHDESNQDHVFVAGKDKATPGQDTFAAVISYVFN